MLARVIFRTAGEISEDVAEVDLDFRFDFNDLFHRHSHGILPAFSMASAYS